MINDRLRYEPDLKAFVCEYPFIRPLQDLPQNKANIMAVFKAQERTMQKRGWREIYNENFDELIRRNFVKKLSPSYIANYKGPIWYLGVLMVAQPKSASSCN